MRNIFAGLSRRGLRAPKALPTVRQPVRVVAWVAAGSLLAFGVVVLGAWLDIDSDEQRLQQLLDERAVWLGGWIDGRQDLRDQVYAAYRAGLADGSALGCSGPRPQRWVTDPGVRP